VENPPAGGFAPEPILVHRESNTYENSFLLFENDHFLKIPAENFRAFIAAIMVLLTLTIWMLMAGTAKLLSILFRGKVHYEQNAGQPGNRSWWGCLPLPGRWFYL
jgi:hypothetical protein